MPSMQAVTSSWIAAIGYAEDNEVYVQLIDGATYVYGQVPEAIWLAFAAADSKGRFVNAVLKPYFPVREA
jgi:KTSC domain